MLILPETPAAEARTLAERIRRQIEETKVTVAGTQIPVTCSFGVAEAPAESSGSDGPRQVLSQADEALYTAKRNGRNQVV